MKVVAIALVLLLFACSGPGPGENGREDVDVASNAQSDAGHDAATDPTCGGCLPAPRCGEARTACMCDCIAGERQEGLVCTDNGCWMPQDMMDAGARPDAAADASFDAGTDASQTDAGADPYEGRPLGQCTMDDDCPQNPNGSNCSEALPGGACLGCGDDSHCPGTTTCSQFGACVTECSADDDCPPGLDCKGNGFCGATACVDGVCPVPLFGCSESGQCERIACTGPQECPSRTTCTGGWCIEDRAL